MGPTDPAPTPPCGRQQTTSLPGVSGRGAVPPCCRCPRGWGVLGGRDGSLPAPPREGQGPPSPAPKISAERLPPRTCAGGGSCWLSRRRARSRPESATLATPLPGRRRRATSSATPAGRRTREGPCVSPRLDGKRRVRKNQKRVRPVLDLLAAALWRHARIQLNHGEAWNSAGQVPPGIGDLDAGDGSVWVGCHSFSPESRGLIVLGAPLVPQVFRSLAAPPAPAHPWF